MSAIFELNAKHRTHLGKAHSRRLRHQEQVPAVLYGAGHPAQALSITHSDILKALQHEAFYSHILTLHIEGKPQKAVLKAMQRHPFKPKVMHMDFLRVDATHDITMTVPLHFKGEEEAPGVKLEKGAITKYITSVDIRCLPAKLPEFIAVDVSNLALNQSLHLTAIILPEGVSFAHKIEDAEHDQVVVTIVPPRSEAPEEEAPATPEAETPPTAE